MKPLPWSFSSLNSFKTCPYSHSEVKVYKHIKEEQGEAALWGDWVHKQIEAHYKTLGPYHENMLPYVPHIERAIAWAGGHGFHAPKEGQKFGKISFSEYQMSIGSDLKPCTWKAERVWCRGIADVLILEENTAWVVDWKTGKVKPDSKQLALFALLVFYHFPRITMVHTSFEWLQHNTETRESFVRGDIPRLWKMFLPDLLEYKTAFKTETWQKRPSGLCQRYCAVHKCPHNGHYNIWKLEGHSGPVGQ